MKYRLSMKCYCEAAHWLTLGPSYVNCDNETQMCSQGEANLHKHLNGCTKNPGHTYFRPIDKFTIKDLPQNHRDNDLFNFVKAAADLTVRVDVPMISPYRPEHWPNTKIPYPFFKDKGKKLLRTGSGEINVHKYKNGVKLIWLLDLSKERMYNQAIKCPCRKCQLSEHPNTVWYEVLVTTARHVVFDDIEARETSLRLFYDKQDSPVVRLDGVSIFSANTEFDSAILQCATCDVSIGEKLFRLKEKHLRFRNKVIEIYALRSNDDFNFLVSHPHGCTKQVSFGQWKNYYKMRLDDRERDLRKLTYTTSTCPGSSGARVYSLGYCDHVHSGTLLSGLNYSSTGCYHIL
ncbi:uncharacterized protein LOC106076698 isoform X2 [Biomphalaria glabrata]|uniref:Uncharacterized protein LOC106076698 isoform X2 n=1 Tax=Biomphalaria glabrata TaxID=6526 RepID=A0A9W3BBL5_BIOGL|nr:uncharacterized protein LOC106076698 isoform X2 [Biomphalaria glabrata]